MGGSVSVARAGDLGPAGRPERYPGAYALRTPERPAIITDTGFQQSFSELDGAANRLSRVLRAAGLGVGDHVAILLENHDRYAEVVWGCHYAGLVYTAISSRYTPAEVALIVQDSQARALITSARLAQVATEGAAECSDLSLRLMLDGAAEGFESYEQALAHHPPEPLPDPRIAGQAMMYSSGTSGVPKAVAHPHARLPLEFAPAGSSYAGRKFFGIDESSVYLSTAPLYHSGPLGLVMGATALGATVVVMRRFEPEAFLAAIEKHEVTHTFVVPTMMGRVMRLEPEVREVWSTGSLRMLLHAAAPCPPKLKREVIEWLGPVVAEFYAGTEANGMVFCNSEQWLAHPGTVGAPVGCMVHICDEAGDELPQGETGLIYFANAGVDFEYRGDREKTSSSRHPRGWTTLGDVGHLDEDGYLFLTDRKSNLIISGGVNVYPQEVENHLLSHPAVDDVAVIGAPHDDFGEQVIAVVKPREMPADPAALQLLEAALIAHCRSALADVKCPRRVDFREALPREPTGKLLKRLLKDEYWSAEGRRI
jgi:acyl-CoA synthetase (AMP-forming)/AMP-acid ligase II